MQTDEKMVDIDTSGEDTEVVLNQEDQSTDTAATESTEEISTETVATQPEAVEEKQEATEEAPKETKKEELENYSKDVQRRIAKLTKKWRDAERERDEALSFAQLQRKRAESLNKKYSTLEQSSLENRKEKIDSLLEAQKAKLAQVRESGDTNAEIEIQKQIAQLGYEEAELKKMASRIPVESEIEEPAFSQQTAEQPQQPAPDPKAEAWAARNRWFGTDKAMTYTSFDLHRTLVDEEGFDPKSDEYYEELDKRLRVEFPHKFDKPESTESAKPVQTVASATRSTKTSRKTVRLTPSQVAIAKKLGVPLEEYAKQLKLTKEV